MSSIKVPAIKRKQVQALIDRGFREPEIAAFFSCSMDAIKKRFAGMFPRGKPPKLPKPDDIRKIRQLAALNCTDSEIATVMSISVGQMSAWKAEIPAVAEAINDGRNEGNISLRRKKWQMAIEEGNPALIIWESKQRLGEQDRQNIDIDAKVRGGVLLVPAPVDPESWAAAAAEHQRRLEEEERKE